MNHLRNQKITFIGAGQMCEAILSGLLRQQATLPENILLYDVSSSRLQQMGERYCVPTATPDGGYRLEGADIVVLSVKPQNARELLEQIGGSFHPGQIVLSILGGVPLELLERQIRHAAVVRAMPNTPMLVGEGAAGIALGRGCTQQTGQLMLELFELVGASFLLPERLIDPLTGISGCGPAFAYLFLEALADGGVELGLPRDVALRLAAQTLVGAGKMVLETGRHPGVLKDQVCSPGGGTIAGVHTLERHAFRGAVADAVVSSVERMEQVGKNAL